MIRKMSRGLQFALKRNSLLAFAMVCGLVVFGTVGWQTNAQSDKASSTASNGRNNVGNDEPKLSAAKLARIQAERDSSDSVWSGSDASSDSLSASLFSPESPGANPVIFAYNFNNDHLVSFNADNPGTFLTDVAVTGLNLANGEFLAGIDFRPLNGSLYGIASDGLTDRVVSVNTTTGAITNVGGTIATLAGLFYGTDFNPAVDRIRQVSDSDVSRRLNPDNGTVAATDTNLAYVTGDANAGANPNVVHAAYTNNTPGATTTTLYGIDSGRDVLVIIGGLNGNPSPNGGQLTTVGPLGVNATGFGGFDIQQGTNIAYASLNISSVPNLCRINLTTGAATVIGPIGPAGTVIDGLAIPFSATGGSADLAITKTNNQTTYAPGSTTTYTIVASNPTGPDPIVGGTVTDTISSLITTATWTCTGTGGGVCPATGTGNISAQVDIPVGGSVTFTVSCVISSSASASLVNTASIAVPAGVTDPTSGNNSATDTDLLQAPAANVEVGGRVVTLGGLPIRGALVSLTPSGGGATRSVTTNSFGYYNFQDIASGQTYVASVSSKRYTYTSRNVQVTGNLTNVDFVSLQ